LAFDLPSHVSCLSRFTQQPGNRAPQRATEFVSLERPHERVVERIHDVCGQFVEISAVAAVEPETATSKVECVIAQRADPVLRLPTPTSLDAEPGMQRGVDRVTEQFVCRKP